MQLIQDMLDTLDTDAPVRDVRVCVRATAVLSRRLGVAYTFPRIHKGHSAEQKRAKRRLRDLSARELAKLALSDDSLDASVGVAAINSLLDPERLKLGDGNAKDVILEKGKGKNITVVGHFPFVEKLREHTRNLWVLELAPRDGDLPASEASTVIPKSDVLALTATSLINHTAEGLLELAKQGGCYTVMLGPTTPLSPVLFDHGVDAIAGSVAVDPETAMLDASEGVSFRYMGGLRSVNALKEEQ